jgi:nodulation protein E
MEAAITGLGVLAPGGTSVEAFWNSLVDGVTANKEASAYPGSAILVGELPEGPHLANLPRARPAVCDRSALMAVAAAKAALADAGLSPAELDPDRVGVVLGNGAGGQTSLEEQYRDLYVHGQQRPSPLTVAKVMPSSSASWVSMAFGFRGPVFVVTSACASSTQAIGIAAQMIQAGLADVMITGGTEACLTNGVLRAWASMGVLAPDACRPFSYNRRGIILSEGCGIIVLESLAHARARGAAPSAAVAGYGFTADAGEITAPNASGMARAMAAAIGAAGWTTGDVDYVNAHGTGTKANDIAETTALRAVFGSEIPATSSTKGVHGHALGASGALEAVATVLAMRHALAPPTANHDGPDPACDFDCIPNVARPMAIRAALTNSFAFGGINASLAISSLA